MRKIALSISIILSFLISSNTLNAKNDEKNTKQVRQRERMRNQPRITDPNLARKRAEIIRKYHQQRLRQRGTKRAEAMKEFPNRPGKTRYGVPHPVLKGKAGEQMQKLQIRLIREEDKYFRRSARLMRIRELAKEQGNQDVIDRADKLMQKERLRYSQKRRKLTMKKRDILQKQSGRKEPRPLYQRQMQQREADRTIPRPHLPPRVPKQHRESLKPENTEK